MISFIALQAVLFLFMILHDWIDLPPFTDLKALKKAYSFKGRSFSSALNGVLVLVPLALAIFYYHPFPPLWVWLLSAIIYGFITLGTLTAWWLPYFGILLCSWNEAQAHVFRNTHSFLPPRGSNVIPNTLHVILHLQVWTCFGFSLYGLYAAW